MLHTLQGTLCQRRRKMLQIGGVGGLSNSCMRKHGAARAVWGNAPLETVLK